MAKMSGFIFQDRYLDQLKTLSDQELGRLVRSLSLYHKTGEVQELKGRECMAYDFIRFEIDEAEKGYQAKCETNRRNRLSAAEGNRGSTSTNVKSRYPSFTSVMDCQPTSMTENDGQQSSTTVVNQDQPSTPGNESVNITDTNTQPNGTSSRICGGDSARVYESQGFGSVYTDEELAAAQKQRMEDVPAIERLMRECGYDFAPTDETIALELMGNGESPENIMNAVMIAKENNALKWSYIKGVLKKQREGGTGNDFRRSARKVRGSSGTRTIAGGTGYVDGRTSSTRSGSSAGENRNGVTDAEKDAFEQYLESTFV